MNTGLSGSGHNQISFISLLPFMLIAFGLAWGLFALFIFFPDPIADFLGS